MAESAFFIGDHTALDFLNSIAAPHGTALESLADGEAYLAWLSDAGLLEGAESKALLDKFGKQALDRVAGEARELREGFRQVIEKTRSTGARRRTEEVVGKLNQILAMDRRYRQLVWSGQLPVLQEKREFTQARQLLAPLALAIAELMTDADPALIKRCANPNCTLWFYDRTKAHTRKFCSTAVCGNRAKVAAFRARQRQSN